MANSSDKARKVFEAMSAVCSDCLHPLSEHAKYLCVSNYHCECHRSGAWETGHNLKLPRWDERTGIIDGKLVR